MLLKSIEEVVPEATRFSKCLALKLLLNQLQQAVEGLVAELDDRSREARRETHPSLEAADRFVKGYQGSFKQFWHCFRPVVDKRGRLPELFNELYELTTDFFRDLRDILPVGEHYFLASVIFNDVEWKRRLEASSDRVGTLLTKLKHIESTLADDLRVKSDLYSTIDRQINRLMESF